MEPLTLHETPKNPIIIEGFPGFGLIGTITTEFLIEHLKMRRIGHIYFPEIASMVAIHNGDMVHPIGIFYNEEHNLVIVHIIANAQGLEHKIADQIMQLASRTEASHIITLEGVAGEAKDGATVFCYRNSTENPIADKLEEKGIKPLSEGIVMGVTSALMLKARDLPLSALFAMTHSQLPDSKASAEVIKVLDEMLGLQVDYHPLLKAAQIFEQKLKNIMTQTQNAMDEKQKKQINYVG
ncbi:MAG: proteasome assembly chaperone family protein [Nanoarchaeota archaeon]